MKSTSSYVLCASCITNKYKGRDMCKFDLSWVFVSYQRFYLSMKSSFAKTKKQFNVLTISYVSVNIPRQNDGGRSNPLLRRRSAKVGMSVVKLRIKYVTKVVGPSSLFMMLWVLLLIQMDSKLLNKSFRTVALRTQISILTTSGGK